MDEDGLFYSRHWTGTSSQWRLLQGGGRVVVIIEKRLMSFAFEGLSALASVVS